MPYTPALLEGMTCGFSNNKYLTVLSSKHPFIALPQAEYTQLAERLKQLRERGFWSETSDGRTLFGNAAACSSTTQTVDSEGIGVLAACLPTSLPSGSHKHTRQQPAGLILRSSSGPLDASTTASIASGVDAYAVEMGLVPTSKDFKFPSLVLVATDADHESLTTKLTSAREGKEPLKVLFVGDPPAGLTCGDDEIYTLGSTSFETLKRDGYWIANVQV